MSMFDKLVKKQLIKNYPGFIKNNTQYETQVGSVSYGVSEDKSDVDIMGICIPPKYIVFPHLNGEIPGFGSQIQRFENFQQHGIKDKAEKKKYDIVIYSIVKFFQLCMVNNPNMIDSLYVPRRCILHTTQIGEHLRQNRKIFLHRGCWFRFKHYAYSQMHKMNVKEPEVDSNRYESIQKFGYDVKFAYNVVRLLNEAEQILIEHDLDLERSREQLKSIRRGEWKQEQIIKYFNEKEPILEKIYSESTLPNSPDEDNIKRLLLECLEMHYGSISDSIKVDVPVNRILDDIEGYVQKLRTMINS